jgi:hypothetical protein
MEVRLNVAVGELQRQAEAEKRSLGRQMQNFERRLQDHMNAPNVGRERWADLQGSVSGVLEEMAALSRRVEGLDEKLRVRTTSCEETVRQRTRDLEQQLHAQTHKSHLAASTTEEVQKRHMARLQKVGQSNDDHAKRLDALEEGLQNVRPEGQPPAIMQFEARLQDLEARQAAFDEELCGLAAAQAERHVLGESDGTVGARGPLSSHGSLGGDDDEQESCLASVERELHPWRSELLHR